MNNSFSSSIANMHVLPQSILETSCGNKKFQAGISVHFIEHEASGFIDVVIVIIELADFPNAKCPFFKKFY